MLVTLKGGRRYRAKIVGKDEGFDLSVIQINAKHLTQLPFSNSNKLKVGGFVISIGKSLRLNSNSDCWYRQCFRSSRTLYQ